MPPTLTEPEPEPSPAARKLSTSRPSRDITALVNQVSGPLPALIVAWLVGVALVAMLEPSLLLLNVIGFLGAFVAGMVGIGGAVVLIPLLLYAPPLFRMPVLGMHTIAGITMVQVAIAGLTSVLVHRQEGHIDGRLVKILGGSVIVSSFVGAFFSRYLREDLLQVIFASLAVLAVILIPLRVNVATGLHQSRLSERKYLVIVIGIVLGLLVGAVGAGGGFLLVPVMIHLLRVPLRTALGTSLAIVALSAMAGAFGKIVSGQVDFLLAMALVAGALPGAHSGAAVSHRLAPGTLTIILMAFVGLTALWMWIDLLTPS